MTPASNPEFLKQVSEQLADKAPHEVLEWSVREYYPKLTMATAFGPEGCCLVHMIAEIEPRVRVFNLDTGYQFPETLELRERLRTPYRVAVGVGPPGLG